MTKPKAKSKTSWSKTQTSLPHGKRVATRLGNEITRLENTAQMIAGWPDGKHDIAKLKKEINSALAWLHHALTTSTEIPDDFKPAVRRPQRKLVVGDDVVITKRYFADYGYEKPPVCTVLAFAGKRICLRDADGTKLLVSRGHVVWSGKESS